MTGATRFADFIAAMTRLLDAGPISEADLLSRAQILLKTLVATDDWLDDNYAAPDAQHYRQYLLYCDPLQRFSVVSFVWGPGQQTPVHDHATWGLVGMLRGAEVSQAYNHINGALVPGAEERLAPGDVTMVSPSIGDIHRVRNAFDDKTSISVHVYGGDIGAIERHVYAANGAIKPFVSGYANRPSSSVATPQ